MTPVEAKSAIKPGDVFEIRVTINTLTKDNGAYVVVLPDTTIHWLPNHALLAGRRVDRPLGIGDPCILISGPPRLTGRIVAIEGAAAWVHWIKEMSDEIYPLSDLARATAEVEDQP